MEWLKDLSDKLLLWFLRTTSGFGKELTPRTGSKRSRQLWREQRLAEILQGLGVSGHEAALSSDQTRVESGR